MRLHSDNLTGEDIFRAMNEAHKASKVTPDVFFWEYEPKGSRTRKSAWEIQLGTYDQTSGPTKSRRYKNSGNQGATSGYYTDRVWSATYDEWGWFIANLYKIDPLAIFGPYKSLTSFNTQTNYTYV